jgi:hypothetical protein
MNQEDKELLLQDLCTRLPYNLYIRVEEFNVPKNEAITEGFVGNYLKDNRCNDYDADDLLNELADDCISIKPYLRPMSSMTEEEIYEFQAILGPSIEVGHGFVDILDSSIHAFSFLELQALFDWLNAHHFDYRGLIKKGLAIEAPEGMYNLEKK